jgi:hypothetical protein
MKRVLFELPIPSSALTRDPSLVALPKRQCELSLYVESEDGDRKMGFIFEGVEAYKCTYMTARTVDMINIAYDKLVRLGDTPWLAEVSANSSSYYIRRQGVPKDLQHLIICFDDGPCYEVLCASVRPLS